MCSISRRAIYISDRKIEANIAKKRGMEAIFPHREKGKFPHG